MSLENVTIAAVTAEEIDQWAACDISAGVISETDAVTDKVYGVAQNGADSGERVNLVCMGKTRCLVDGSGTAIAAGDELSPSATGGVLVKHAGTSTHAYAGKALEAATTAGAVIWVLLYGSNRAAA